jgi:DNA-binding transcriptional ArsR family regulator
MATASSSETDDLFVALAHPLRRQILRGMLRDEKETSPRDIASDLAEQLSRLSYHVRVLARCGAIALVRTEQVRGSTQHFYRPVVDARWARMALAATEAPPKKAKP